MDSSSSQARAGQDLSARETDKGRRYLAETSDSVVRAVKGLAVVAGLFGVAAFLVGGVDAQRETVESAPNGRKGLMSEPRAVSVAYIEAVGHKQFERVSKLLHPDLEFKMPGKDIHGAEAYIASLQQLAPILLRSEIKKTIVEGDDVCVIYDFVTDTAVGVVPSVEWLTIEDGRIRSIWLVFHSQPWPAVLEELARRAKPAR